ncbi:hypothetical protein Tco_1304534 [Tanacetum coccineum]
MKLKEPTYQVALDALALTTCYHAFLITAEVPVIYMHQFWATVTKHKSSYRFKIDNKRFFVNVEVFRDILNICPKVPGKAFDEPPTEKEALSFIRELGHSRKIKYITDVIVDHLHQPWRTFASIINKCLYGKVYGFDKIRLSRVQILYGMYYKKNLVFVALIREDMAYQIDNIDSKKQDKMFYPRFTKIIIHHFLNKDKSISMRNRTFMHTAHDDSLLGVEPPMSRKGQKKSDSAISSEESPSKKKSAKAKKVAATKPKPTKKKAPVKADKGKGLNVLSEVTLSEADQLKEAIELSKKDSYVSHPSGSGTDEGTGTKLGVPDVPKYDSKSEKESWGDSGEEDDDDEDDSNDDGDDDDDGNDGNDGNGDDDNDANDDDNQEDDDKNDDEEKTDSDRTKSNRIENLVLNQSTTEYYKEEEEKDDDEEKMDEEEDDEVIKELYNDVNVNLGNRDADMTDADQVTKVLELTSVFTTTVPPPPPFFNPLPQQATPTPTPITSVATTSFPALPDFASVFKFNERVTNLEKDLSEMKQVDQYAKALSFIPAILDRYIDNKLREAINKAIEAHNLDCRQEARD